MRQALSNSYNTVSVRVLADLVTPENSFNFVEEHFHLDLEDGVEIGGQMKSDIGVAPLSMGGLTYGLSTEEMAAAFSAFANSGVYNSPKMYTEVRDSNGETVLKNEGDGAACMPAKASLTIE